MRAGSSLQDRQSGQPLPGAGGGDRVCTVQLSSRESPSFPRRKTFLKKIQHRASPMIAKLVKAEWNSMKQWEEKAKREWRHSEGRGIQVKRKHYLCIKIL